MNEIKREKNKEGGIIGKRVSILTRMYNSGNDVYYNEIIGEVVRFDRGNFLILRDCELRVFKNNEIIERKFIQKNFWVHLHIIAFIQEID